MAASVTREGGSAGTDTGGAPSAQVSGGAGSKPALRQAYLELRPLGFLELPYHADFGAEADQSKHPELKQFVGKVFEEAKALDPTRWRKTGSKTFDGKSKASGITVAQLAQQEGKDTWFARHSIHPDNPGDGKENWEVFDHVLRDEHSKNEAEYTPNVFDHSIILRWPREQLEVPGWKDVDLYVVNMYHGIPFPLNDRVFTELVLSGIRTDLSESDATTDEFVDVQLALDINTLPEDIRARAHHRGTQNPVYHPDEAGTPSSTQREKKGHKLVHGEYVSVEKGSRIQREGKRENHLVMGTASDAKGNLPLWVQKKAVPGEVVKDVEFVYDFIAKHKGEAGWPGA